MSYVLGVDLGTTYTAAAVGDGRQPSMLALGNRAHQVPSALFLNDDGFVVGESAEWRGAVEPTAVARDFPRRLGDHLPVLVGGSPFSAEVLMARLLSWVVAQATMSMDQAPLKVVLTHPASWGPFKLDLLRQVVTLAEVPDATLCLGAAAAAVRYASRASLDVGERVAVYDLGGGSFDTCVLEKTQYGFRLVGSADGAAQLGGTDLDETLFRHVLSVVGYHADFRDPDAAVGLARLRLDCREAKEALTSDVDTVVPVTLPGLLASVHVTRNEFESLIKPALEQTVELTARTLRSGAVSPNQLAAMLLVGGCSRIPLVAELLEHELQIRTSPVSHSKHDVALGAVLLGLGQDVYRTNESDGPEAR
jgi:molecular chaperone DnaK (HSP70)